MQKPDPALDPEPSGMGESRSVAQLKMLHSLAAKLNRLADVRQIGEAIVTELRSLIDYHNSRVFVLDADGETLLPVAFRGELLEYQGETFEALVTKVGYGLTGHVALTGKSYYSPNANDDPFAKNPVEARGRPVRRRRPPGPGGAGVARRGGHRECPVPAEGA